MKRFVLLPLILGLISAGVASGVEGQPVDRSIVINSCDRNLDGQIDREEYHMRLTEVFFLTDVDKDGQLMISEIQAIVRDMRPGRLRAADRDGNGKLSMGEFHNALSEDFNAADRNADGTLNPDEVRHMLQER